MSRVNCILRSFLLLFLIGFLLTCVLVSRAATAGVPDAMALLARSDTYRNDFVRALVGVFRTTALPGWEQSASRLVDIVIAGSRSTPKQTSASPRTRQK